MTNQVEPNLLLISKQKALFWPGLTWTGQNGTFVLKSTGGLAQPDVSPCTDYINIMNLGLGAVGGGGQVQGGGKQPFQFSLGDKHQGPNSIEEILA